MKEVEMCTCVETIQKTFIGVKKQTDKIDVCSSDIDSFLDRINSIRKPVENVTGDILQFVELVREHFVELNGDDSKMLLDEFVKTRQKMYVVYAKLHKSSLYVCMKTAVKNFYYSARFKMGIPQRGTPCINIRTKTHLETHSVVDYRLRRFRASRRLWALT